VSEEIAKIFPADYRDPDGMFATSRIWLSSIAYNTNLVKPEDAPKSFADLLDPNGPGKMVKGHPAYSGTIMTRPSRRCANGLGLLRGNCRSSASCKCSRHRSTEEMSLGERAGDGRRQRNGIVLLKEAGQPVEPVYPAEGTPTFRGRRASSPPRRIPMPRDCSRHGCIPAKPSNSHRFHRAIFGACAVAVEAGPAKISDIKLMKEDAAGVEQMTEEIKTRYAKLFRV